MPYRIDYSPAAEDHLRALTARQRAINCIENGNIASSLETRPALLFPPVFLVRFSGKRMLHLALLPERPVHSLGQPWDPRAANASSRPGRLQPLGEPSALSAGAPTLSSYSIMRQDGGTGRL